VAMWTQNNIKWWAPVVTVLNIQILYEEIYWICKYCNF